MEKTVPLSLTIEEAVAEMVNIDYIPEGFTLLDMTEAFQEEAEVDYENALIDRLPEDQLASLKLRMDSCSTRHTLAQQLLESLQYEVKNPKNSIIVFAKDSSSHQRLTRMSVWEWAVDRYGISISMGTNQSNTVALKTGDSNTDTVNASTVAPNAITENLEGVRWEDVTIKIWKDYKIGYSYEKGKFKKSTFLKIGLMDQRSLVKPKYHGMILIGLSKEKIFPGGRIEDRHKAAIWKLKQVLCSWTGLSDDPFLTYNKHDGWKPRFKLIYDVRNAANRAEEKAPHESFDDSKAYMNQA